MIKNVKLIINGRDFSDRLSTYRVRSEVTYTKKLVSIDDTEHYGAKKVRDVIEFSLFPADPSEILKDRLIFESPVLSVDYTDPGKIADPQGAEMVLTTDLDSIFLLNSSDGKMYYKGATISLRSRRAV